MRHPPPAPAPRWPAALRRGLYLAAGLGAGVLLSMAGCRTEAPPPPKPPPEPEALQGWQLRFPHERYGGQAAGFEGAYRRGEVLWVPAGAGFLLEPEPAGLKGALVLTEKREAWAAHGGRLEPRPGTSASFSGRAPDAPGLYRLAWLPEVLSGSARNETAQVLVLEEAEARAHGAQTRVSVQGEALGSYADPAASKVPQVREHATRYERPRFFAALDEDTLGLAVGDGLLAGQLVAFMERRDAEGHKIFTTQRHTRVFPPARALNRKLCLLRERLRERGVKLNRFWITSGFRTPDYNRRIGGAAFSRHCFGDAADLCIDEDGDKRMDDLNGDGKAGRLDGIAIARACLELEAEGAVVPGGIGVYEWDGDESVRSHVHVDCRGYPVRWGQASRGKGKSGFDWWTRLGVVSSTGAADSSGE